MFLAGAWHGSYLGSREVEENGGEAVRQEGFVEKTNPRGVGCGASASTGMVKQEVQVGVRPLCFLGTHEVGGFPFVSLEKNLQGQVYPAKKSHTQLGSCQ